MSQKKRKYKYVIARTFYSRIAFYVFISIFLIFFCVIACFGFSYLAGLTNSEIPADVCEISSDNFNAFYCLLVNGKDSKFYDLLYYSFIIFAILCVLALIIVNVFYITNGFYFTRLVKEKSCGAVIYKKENNKIYYLLLKMNYGHTSLCKGHQEEGETDQETAIREIKEETNLDVSLNTDFKVKITYQPNELAIKDVYFYLATPIDQKAVPQDLHDEEVNSFEWCEYEEALFKITYDSDRNVLKKAHTYIELHNLIKKKD